MNDQPSDVDGVASLLTSQRAFYDAFAPDMGDATKPDRKIPGYMSADLARTLVEDSMMSRPGPKIRFDCRTEPDLVLRHAWAWERVLINLFCNAVQAMPQGGTIFVDARRQDNDIQIVVADEGSGIAPELLAVVFDPRVSTKTLGGLGLHVVRSIVTQEAGEVRAANRDGRGAEFTITLPAQPVISRVVGA